MTNAPFGRLFDWQLDWLRARDEGGVKFSCLEIHRRGRKSSTALNLSIRDAFRLQRTRHNIIGPSFEQVRRIYFDDPTMLKASLPGREGVDYKINEQRMIVRFPRVGSVLQFYGGDDPDNLRGIDGESFTFDEWSQCKLGCWTEIVQPIVEQYPERYVNFLYTPAGQNHATDMFDHACYVDEGDPLPVTGRAARCRELWYAARLAAASYRDDGSLKIESGIFTLEALERIRQSPKTTKEIFEQEYMCERLADEQFALITSAMLDKLSRKQMAEDGVPAVISCDPAFGGDECSIGAHVGRRLLEHDEIRSKDENLILARIRVMSDSLHIYDFVVDEIGVGRLVAHALEQDERYKVIRFNSSHASSNSDRFRNLRAEAYWKAAQDAKNFKVQYPADAELRKQLPFASRYKPDGRGIQILSKTDIRNLLGHSPDRADQYVMGRWALQFARPYLGKYPLSADAVWSPHGDRLVNKPTERKSDPMDYVSGPETTPKRNVMAEYLVN